MKFAPKKATRKGQTMRTAIFGLSGSGKTLYALETANVLTDGDMSRVFVIDTENESSGLYSGKYHFMIQPWEGPHNPADLAELIRQADESPEVDVIIVDGLSPFWDGKGGMLDIVEQEAAKAKSRSGKSNSFAGWGIAGGYENDLKHQILNCRSHLIMTMRGKNFTPDDSDEGLQHIKVKPVQRDTVFYEFNTAVYVHKNHSSVITKARCEEIPEGTEFPAKGGARQYAETELAWLSDNTRYISVADAQAIKDKFASIPKERRKTAKDRYLEAKFSSPDRLAIEEYDSANEFVNELVKEYTAAEPWDDAEDGMTTQAKEQ